MKRIAICLKDVSDSFTFERVATSKNPITRFNKTARLLPTTPETCLQPIVFNRK